MINCDTLVAAAAVLQVDIIWLLAALEPPSDSTSKLSMPPIPLAAVPVVLLLNVRTETYVFVLDGFAVANNGVPVIDDADTPIPDEVAEAETAVPLDVWPKKAFPVEEFWAVRE